MIAKICNLFSRLYDVSTFSCAHLTIILSSSSICLCHSSLLPLISFPPSVPNLFRPGKFRSTSFSSSRWDTVHNFFGSLPSSTRWTCPYHLSCLILVSPKRDLVIFIFCLIIFFLILSFLEIRAERRQKSISVEFSFATVFAFKHHVSAAYVIVVLTIAW